MFYRHTFNAYDSNLKTILKRRKTETNKPGDLKLIEADSNKGEYQYKIFYYSFKLFFVYFCNLIAFATALKTDFTIPYAIKSFRRENSLLKFNSQQHTIVCNVQTLCRIKKE